MDAMRAMSGIVRVHRVVRDCPAGPAPSDGRVRMPAALRGAALAGLTMKTRPAKRPRPKMATEEGTLELLDSLPGVQRTVAVHLYLVAAFWPWWLTLFVPAFVLWRVFPETRLLAIVSGAFAVLALGGWFVKGVIEDRAPDWARRA